MPALRSILNFKFSILNSRQRRGGFTLIELMIAISIIAIVSAIGLTSYTQAQKLARDAKRKQDLRSISIALELYYQKNKRYPCHELASVQSSATPNTFWITDTDIVNCVPGATTPVPLDTLYINYMPNDLTANNFDSNNTSTYGYSYQTPNFCQPPYPQESGQYYTLRTRLENKLDPERCEAKQYVNCDGEVICRAGAESKNDLFIITSQ